MRFIWRDFRVHIVWVGLRLHELGGGAVATAGTRSRYMCIEVNSDVHVQIHR